MAINLTYKIVINNTEHTVAPLLKVVFKGNRDGMNYKRELKNGVTFLGSDYSLIVGAFSDCSKIIFKIIKNGILYYQGYFKRTDCKTDEDLCVLRANIKTDDVLDKFKTEGDIEHSPYQVPSQVSSAYFGTLETIEMIFEETHSSTNNNVAPVITPAGSPSEWCPNPLRFQINEYTDQEDAGGQSVTVYKYQHITTWGRVVGIGTPTEPPLYGGGWTHLEGNNWFRCVGVQAISCKNGRSLKSVIEYLLAQIPNVSISLKSHFFGWNVLGDTPLSISIASNIAYEFAALWLKHLVLHQKSDVKRPFDSGVSQSQTWKMKLSDLLNDLKKLFGIDWIIEGTILRVEHISYFSKPIGINAVGASFRKKFQYNLEDAVIRETFKYVDDTASVAFTAKDIEYDCVTEKRIEEHKLSMLHTDIMFIQNPDNAEKIRDEGFVLVATEQFGGNSYILDNNMPLSYPILHENLFRHGRKFPTGKINNVATTFLSSQKTKQQEALHLCVPHNTNFDPYALVQTEVGQGEVDNYEYDVLIEILRLELKY